MTACVRELKNNGALLLHDALTLALPTGSKDELKELIGGD